MRLGSSKPLQLFESRFRPAAASVPRSLQFQPINATAASAAAGPCCSSGDRQHPCPAMFAAIQTGDDCTVQQLLSAGHPINAPVHKSLPALHLAVQLGQLHIVQLLLSAGASLDRVMICPSALYLAVLSTCPSSAQIRMLLLQAGADIRCVHHCSPTTVLHVAAQAGPLSTVQALLDAGVDCCARDSFGQTALFAAIQRSSGEAAAMVSLLCSGRSATAGAAAADAVVTQTTPNHQPPSAAASLAAASVPVAGGATTATAAAAPVSASAYANLQDNAGDTALHSAAEYGSLAAVKALLAAGAAVDTRNHAGRTPVHAATTAWLCGADAGSVLRELLTAGAVVTVADNSGTTPLHLAAAELNGEVVQFLLAEGADACAVDSTGATALCAAAAASERRAQARTPANIYSLFTGSDMSEVEARAAAAESAASRVVVCQLVAAFAYSATVSALTSESQSTKNRLLHPACAAGDNAAVQMLLDAGADPNAVHGESGDCPLHVAAAAGHTATVQVLLQAGAYVLAVRSNPTASPPRPAWLRRCSTVLELAIEGGDAAMVRVVLAAGLQAAAEDGSTAPLVSPELIKRAAKWEEARRAAIFHPED